jgi:small-conductance mechanosensitive channel
MITTRRPGPSWRLACLVATMLVVWLLLPSFAAAQEPGSDPAAGGVSALPEPLSPQTIRDLIARLSDDEVRALLISQLDKVAVSDTTPAARNAPGFVNEIEAGASSVRTLWSSRITAMPLLPSVIPFFLAKMADGKTATQLVLTVVGIAAMFGLGVVAERVFLHFTARQRALVPDARVARFTTRMGYLLQRLVWQIVSLIVFAVGALVAFFALYQGHGPTRIAVMTALAAIVIWRLMSDISRFLLAPHAPTLRLIPFDDAATHSLHHWLMAVVGVGAIGFLTADLLGLLGLEQPILAAFRSLIGLAFTVLLMLTIWQARKPVSALIRGPSPGSLRRLIADWWHILAILYVFGIWLTAQVRAAVGGEVSTGGAIFSLLLVVALPLADITLRRLATDYFEARRAARGPAHQEVTELDAGGVTTVEVDADEDDEGGVAAPPPPVQAPGSYEPAILKALRIVLWIGGFLVFLRLWDIDIYNVTQDGIGETAAGALFNVVITILLGYLVWEIIKATIDRRVDMEAGPVAGEIGGEGGGHGGASRLRTLLPLARKAIFVTLIVMVVMIILSSLGVHIGPLLAGAGVVGIAIGFGAQTLVRDIVSGVFFLLDDAFRVGEYIDLGDVKGTVEKISIRSMQLRHHRGALNTVPFGEIKYLTNYSRDWAIMKLQFRVTYDTDVNQVKKIFKQINVELMENEEIAANLLEPLKSQGVLSMEDSAMIIRAKFTAKPGEQFVIRREVYARVQKAFDEAGIKFAHREVTVHVPEAEHMDRDRIGQVAGAAARRMVEDDEAAAAGPAKASA